MVLMGIEPYVQKGVQGLLIIAAVALALEQAMAGDPVLARPRPDIAALSA